MDAVNLKKNKKNNRFFINNGIDESVNSNNPSINDNNYKKSQSNLMIRKATNNESNLSKDLKQFRQEDLELILKISNQTMQISQEMKSSLARTEGNLNNIEENVLDIKDNMKNGNSEVNKYCNDNKTDMSKYCYLLMILLFVVIVLIFIIYKMFFS